MTLRFKWLRYGAQTYIKKVERTENGLKLITRLFSYLVLSNSAYEEIKAKALEVDYG